MTNRKDIPVRKNVKLGLIIGGIAITVLVILPLIAGLVTGWKFCEYEEGGYGMMGFGMMEGGSIQS